MIRALHAIMRTTVRHAWATRSIFWLMTAALVPAILFPLIIKGDGTPAGAQVMLLTYAPIALFAVLLIGSVWMGAYALAAERLQLQLSMLKTKPISGLAIWLGKWLAVCAINLSVLLCSGLVFAGMLQLRGVGVDTASRSFWQPHSPDEGALLQQAEALWLRRRTEAAQAEEPQTVPPLQQIVNRMRQQQYRVPPGGNVSWRIPLPPRLPEKGIWRLTYHWRLDPMRRAPVHGSWHLTDYATGHPLATHPVTGLLDGNHTFAWGILQLPPETRVLELRFQASPENEPHIFFDSKAPISLQHQAGSRAENLLRAAGIAMIFGGALAAVALALSACFSFPVAVFATHGIVLALLVAAVAGQEGMELRHSHGHDHGHPDGWILTYTGHFLDSLHAHTHALRAALPFRRLSESIQITFHEHAIPLFLLAICLPLLCAAIAHIKIKREEVTQ